MMTIWKKTTDEHGRICYENPNKALTMIDEIMVYKEVIPEELQYQGICESLGTIIVKCMPEFKSKRPYQLFDVENSVRFSSLNKDLMAENFFMEAESVKEELESESEYYHRLSITTFEPIHPSTRLFTFLSILKNHGIIDEEMHEMLLKDLGMDDVSKLLKVPSFDEIEEVEDIPDERLVLGDEIKVSSVPGTLFNLSDKADPLSSNTLGLNFRK